MGLIEVWSVIPLENGEPYLVGEFRGHGQKIHSDVVGAYDYLKLAVGWAQSLNVKASPRPWSTLMSGHDRPPWRSRIAERLRQLVR